MLLYGSLQGLRLLGALVQRLGQQLLLLPQQLRIGGIQLQQLVDLLQGGLCGLGLLVHLGEGLVQLGGIPADLNGEAPDILLCRHGHPLLAKASISSCVASWAYSPSWSL